MTPSIRRLAVHAYLRRLAASTKPILLGPWRSEVGFEALYWLPFLRWAVKTYGITPSRIVTVTRGGASLLYGTASVDLYRLRSVDEVRLENLYDWQRTQLQKQTHSTPWDRDVLHAAAAAALGRQQRYHVLHPTWMYWALSPFWEEQRGLPYLTSMTDYEPLPKVKRLDHDLPAHYVAMKWYDRATFPLGDPAVQTWIRELISIVGAQTKIVLLTGTPQSDDHIDVEVRHPNVVSLPPAQPDQNLAQQIQILSHADGFVGTYGGMAQLALRMGVPSCSFYRQFGGTCHAHLSLSSWIAKRTNVPFAVGSLEEGQLWRRAVSPPLIAKEGTA